MCAGILSGVMGLLALLAGNPPFAVLISAAIAFAYCFCWFWLLVRVGSSGIWWVILGIGVLLPIFARIALRSALAG